MLPIVMFFQQAAPAAGDAAAADPLGGMLGTLLLPIGMIAIFYFLLIRPQNNRMKKHKELLSQLKKGDTVVTQGGIIGKVSKVGDDGILEVEIAEGVKVKMPRHTIAQVMNKTEPAKAA